MEKSVFFNGLEIGADELNSLTSSLEYQIKKRTVDFFSKGVIGSNSDSFAINDVNNTLKILPFVAYTVDGERIYVYKEIRALAMDLSNPEERRLTQQGTLSAENFGWPIDTDLDIYVSYFISPASPKAHVTTKEFFPTKYVSGFEFYALRPGIDPVINLQSNANMVRLCRVNFNGESLTILTTGYMEFSTVDASKIYTNDNATKPTNYNPYSPVSIQDHIMCIGSGTPTPNNPHGYTPEDLGIETTSVNEHETNMHTPGIICDRSSVTSGLYIGLNYISNATDNLVLYNLTQTEKLHSNGFWLSTILNSSKGRFFINFMDGYSPNYNILPDGTYKIGVVPEDGSIVMCCDIATTGRYAIVSEDPDAITEVTRVPILSYSEYSNQKAFDLAEFTFSSKKGTSFIVSSIPYSNFITKKDLRVIGSTSSSELATTKDGSDDVLTLPYTLKVSKIMLQNGEVISGGSILPPGFISGFSIVYNTKNSITVTPGYARDNTNSRDIYLNNSITKYVDIPWVPGGTDIAVGGLQNSPTNPFLPDGSSPLHIFVIMNDIGTTDIAIDTNINGNNILNSQAPTYSFKFIRRIGSIYLSPKHTSDGPENEILRQFTSFNFGSGLWIMYTDKPVFEQTYYSSNVFTNIYVPSGAMFTCRFTYNIGESRVYEVKIPNTNSTYFISNAGAIDIVTNSGSLSTTAQWNFADKIACVGYYDARGIQ